MKKKEFDKKKIFKEIRILRGFLIIHTLLLFGFLGNIFFDLDLIPHLLSIKIVNRYLLVSSLLIYTIFIWYNWKRLPIPRKNKIENTWMILFLNLIGLWLWLPNKKQIEAYGEKGE